jgi:pimeloyl-ACP methyl ester carboxylesterase
VTASGLTYDRYFDSEWMMRIGPREAPQILFLPPLFEEMNRTRALVARAMRHLAGAGFGCALPDLPGTGESERALDQVDWSEWRDAVAAAIRHLSGDGRIAATAAIRGGCLLGGAAEAPLRWRFAPVGGASLARDLSRAGLVSGGGTAGYAPSPDLLAALQEAVPEGRAGRTVRLLSDPGDADRKIAGVPLWRRSEPESGRELAAIIASDIEDWVRQCGAC